MDFVKLFIFSIIIFPITIFAGIVGIAGDIHGNKIKFSHALNEMKKVGVTHFIGTGDYVDKLDNLDKTKNQLREVLGLISKTLEIDKKHIYLIPGNWELYRFNDDPDLANKIIQEYGHLITTRHDIPGKFKIGNKKILGVHTPYFPLAEEMAPGRNKLDELDVKNNASNTVLEDKDLNDVDIVIFGHTHIYGYQYSSSGKLILNPGTLSSRKLPDWPFTFSIWNQSSGLIEIKKVQTPNSSELIERIVLPNSNRRKFRKSKIEKVKKDIIENPHYINLSSMHLKDEQADSVLKELLQKIQNKNEIKLIDLSGNKLTRVPACLSESFISKNTIINLSFNKLTSVPDFIKGQRECYLYGNKDINYKLRRKSLSITQDGKNVVDLFENNKLLSIGINTDNNNIEKLKNKFKNLLDEKSLISATLILPKLGIIPSHNIGFLIKSEDKNIKLVFKKQSKYPITNINDYLEGYSAGLYPENFQTLDNLAYFLSQNKKNQRYLGVLPFEQKMLGHNQMKENQILISDLQDHSIIGVFYEDFSQYSKDEFSEDNSNTLVADRLEMAKQVQRAFFDDRKRNLPIFRYRYGTLKEISSL